MMADDAIWAYRSGIRISGLSVECTDTITAAMHSNKPPGMLTEIAQKGLILHIVFVLFC